MKSVILAALVGFSGALKLTTSAGAARAWLSAHAAPQADELAELKDVNPDAYALVKALLTKRSLGLLDPKHPTASFAAHAPEDDAPHGAAAFAGLITPEELASHGKGASLDAPPADSAVYPDAPAAPKSHDFWNWKPQDSAVSDDAMVKSVLGAVAGLKGAKMSSPVKELSPMEADEASLGIDSAPAAAAPVETAPKARFQPEGNTYLAGLNLDASAPAVSASSDSSTGTSDSNPLTSFSWGDDAKPGPQQAQRAVKKESKKPAVSALSSWLTGGKVDAPAEEAAPEPKHESKAMAAIDNPYLSALQ